MSELSLGTLSGLAANSYVIDVAAGSSLDLSAGAVLPAGSILQVVSTTKTDVFTASLSGRSFSSNVTGLEASITPSSASSKILVTLHMSALRTDSSDIMFKLRRDSTDIAVGDSAGTRQQLTGGLANVTTGSIVTQNMGAQFLDSPASTSALTYGVQLFNPSSSTRTVAVNRTLGDTDDTGFGRHVSTITVMEVAG